MISKQYINRLIEQRVRQLADGRGKLQILEAGCGRRWPFDLSGLDYSITGIDLDANALEFRKTFSRDLDTAVVGDLQTATLDEQAFDVIYCAFVLEHIDDVTVVLNNFAAWIRPGGLLIITVPDRRSVYGFVTRITPHWFHVLYKRSFTPLGNRAGTPGFGPYRTIYDRALKQPSFYRTCSSLGFEVVDEVPFGMLPRYQRFLTRVISALSVNYLKWDHIDLLYVFQDNRTADAARRVATSDLHDHG